MKHKMDMPWKDLTKQDGKIWINNNLLISMRKGAVSLQKPQLGKYKYIQVYIDWSKPQLDNMLSVHHVSLCTNRGCFFAPLLALVFDHV